MKAKYILILLLTLIQIYSYGQDSTYLRQNAIKIERPDSLGADIYKRISKYALIMVGEMHGTNEPAQFVSSLAELLLEKGNHVQIGFEIPSEEMMHFLSEKKDSAIYSTVFFQRKQNDGRASSAWAKLIIEFAQMQNVELFYYDANSGDLKNKFNRDSLMYTKIKKHIQLHPNWKTITLGGNIHNMLLPYEGETKTGLYLYNDKGLHLAESILSVGHYYATGSTWDNSTGTITMNPVYHTDGFFAKTLDYENYLFIFPKDVKYKYNAIYFTRKVSPSELVGNHK